MVAPVHLCRDSSTQAWTAATFWTPRGLRVFEDLGLKRDVWFGRNREAGGVVGR